MFFSNSIEIKIISIYKINNLDDDEIINYVNSNSIKIVHKEKNFIKFSLMNLFL